MSSVPAPELAVKQIRGVERLLRQDRQLQRGADSQLSIRRMRVVGVDEEIDHRDRPRLEDEKG
jgi:hypothetical protein